MKRPDDGENEEEKTEQNGSALVSTRQRANTNSGTSHLPQQHVFSSGKKENQETKKHAAQKKKKKKTNTKKDERKEKKSDKRQRERRRKQEEEDRKFREKRDKGRLTDSQWNKRVDSARERLWRASLMIDGSSSAAANDHAGTRYNCGSAEDGGGLRTSIHGGLSSSSSSSEDVKLSSSSLGRSFTAATSR